MNRAIERAWSRPIRRFWAHTCTLDHPSALGFYKRSGFRPFRRQVEIVKIRDFLDWLRLTQQRTSRRWRHRAALAVAG
jgi:hypothetical protein